MRSGPSWEKKQKHCDPQNPEDQQKGDQWDLVALDVASRFVVSLKVGQRTTADLRAFIGDFATRSGGTPPALLTTDDCVTYAQIFLDQYGTPAAPERTGRPGRPRKPVLQWPCGSVYATVCKT